MVNACVSSQVTHTMQNVTGQSCVQMINDWTVAAPVPPNYSESQKWTCISLKTNQCALYAQQGLVSWQEVLQVLLVWAKLWLFKINN